MVLRVLLGAQGGGLGGCYRCLHSSHLADPSLDKSVHPWLLWKNIIFWLPWFTSAARWGPSLNLHPSCVGTLSRSPGGGLRPREGALKIPQALTRSHSQLGSDFIPHRV